MKNFADAAASWIWITQDENSVNQYVQFRREFDLQSPVDEKARLFIAADSNYAVWINNTFLDCGQFSNYPEDKTYDVLDVGCALKPGKNVLCIFAYYQGRTSFTYLKGEPGLLYALEGEGICIASDGQTRCRISPAYHNGPIYDITM